MASQPPPELFPQTETWADCEPPPLRDCHMTSVLPVYRRHAEGDRRHMSLFKGGFVGIIRLSLASVWHPPNGLGGVHKPAVFNVISRDWEASPGASGEVPIVGESPGRPVLWLRLKR